MERPRFSLVIVFCATLIGSDAAAQPARRPTAAVPAPGEVLDRGVAIAEAALRAGEVQTADSRYRALLFEGWMIAGGLYVTAGDLARARDAFRRAANSVVNADAAFESLALVHLQLREPAEAVAILTKVVSRNPKSVTVRRTLAQALVANGNPEEAVQVLEEAYRAEPDDPETAFLLATGYLHAKNIAAAERMFANVAAARPAAHTYVLIGRTYRDFRLYDAARANLRTALEKDRRARRAHYYLGTTMLMEEGVLRLDQAIIEFREELKLFPNDPASNLRIGMALVEARRDAEALQPLEIASRLIPASPDAWHYLGRCQHALGRPADGVASLRRALELSKDHRVDPVRLRNIHYQLAVSLRQTGAEKDAATHFAEAERASVQHSDADRENLARYLNASDDADADLGEVFSLRLGSPFGALSPSERAAAERRTKEVLARAYLNLGVMQAQAQRFVRAAEFFEQAAEVDASFPQVQYSLGVAYFNAQRHEKAIAPLERALGADPANTDIQRMLALALFNANRYERAASLLAADPQRESDLSLQYAYGLALVRSDQAAKAETVFEQLVVAHGATPELKVVLGQAHAQQGDYESAIKELEAAVKLKADVAEANATLGVIYLRQGKLAEARSALRAELRAHPRDAKAAHTLATVLDLEGEYREAMTLLRSLLGEQPDLVDARYLLGKILLAQGRADEAAEQLEAAARLAPEDANIHFQLSQAYRKQGRTELADQRFAIYQQLKEKRRTQ